MSGGEMFGRDRMLKTIFRGVLIWAVIETPSVLWAAAIYLGVGAVMIALGLEEWMP